MDLYKDSLEKILKKKLIVDEHLKRNDKLLEELESLEYNDNNLKEFIEKFFQFKNDEKQLVEKINDFKEELIKLGVPPRLVL